MTSLEAIALMRSEEQVADFHWKPENRERKTIRRPLQAVGSSRVSCTCGDCKKCRNREWMRAKRGGFAVKLLCVSCGKRSVHNKSLPWCSMCRAKRPAQYRVFASSTFTHGGGI